jgi:hypothetical protein
VNPRIVFETWDEDGKIRFVKRPSQRTLAIEREFSTGLDAMGGTATYWRDMPFRDADAKASFLEGVLRQVWEVE